MIDFTKPVATKGGQKVRILCTDAPGKWPVIGLIEGHDGAYSWTLEGHQLNHQAPQPEDLVNVPEVRYLAVAGASGQTLRGPDNEIDLFYDDPLPQFDCLKLEFMGSKLVGAIIVPKEV